MKAIQTILVILAALPLLAGSEWKEIGCSPHTPEQEINIPAGKVVWVADYFGPAFDRQNPGMYPLKLFVQKAGGSAETWLEPKSHIIGPCRLKMTWTGAQAPGISVYWCTLKVMDVEEPTAVVNLKLEAAPETPSEFKPAAAFFRATESK